jgi:hypothetical protein
MSDEEITFAAMRRGYDGSPGLSSFSMATNDSLDRCYDVF